jgi:hypothetical protein
MSRHVPKTLSQILQPNLRAGSSLPYLFAKLICDWEALLDCIQSFLELLYSISARQRTTVRRFLTLLPDS